ncbi:hypothetical protein CN564_02240 [Bacillus pseudomycoides]|nr:hypothetical protein CN564_02240 [Bacillus pseudomycoides]
MYQVVTIIITKIEFHINFIGIIPLACIKYVKRKYLLNKTKIYYSRQNITIYALNFKCFNKGVIGMTAKKGEDKANKNAVKLQVALC